MMAQTGWCAVRTIEPLEARVMGLRRDQVQRALFECETVAVSDSVLWVPSADRLRVNADSLYGARP